MRNDEPVRKCRRTGFTLLELIVTVVVVAILGAVLVPVLVHSKEKSKDANCISNQKQLVAAMLQYAEDFGGTTAPGVWYTKKGPLTWDTLLEKYLKNKGVLRCAADLTRGARSYAINDQYLRRTQEFDGKGMRISSISPSSKYVLLTDFHNDRNQPGSECYAMAYFAPDDEQQFHSKKTANVYAFFDGHAKCLPLGKITNGNFIFDAKD